MKMFRFWLLVSLFGQFSFADDFSVVKYNISGVIAAFGDFNADKLVDIFVISDSGQLLSVVNATSNQHFSEPYILYNATGNQAIAGAMLADFDGDVLMDILVVLNDSAERGILAEVVWGSYGRTSFTFNETFRDEPVIFDFNGDMLPDLLLETTPGNWSAWLASRKSTFTRVVLAGQSPLKVPGSGAFLNLVHDNDYAADLFLSTVDGFEIYEHGNIGRNNSLKRPLPPYFLDVYASSFGDFNQNGVIDHVVPACNGSSHCSVLAYDSVYGQWYTMIVLDDKWSFCPQHYVHFLFPPTLHIGDYDMDGFPDAVTVLCSSDTSSIGEAFLLHNIPCENSDCEKFGRAFSIQRLQNTESKTLTATFYDIGEDGTLDIVMTSIMPDDNYANKSLPKLIFLKNNLAGDTCFLKVTVVSSHDSAYGRQPYGVNVPGPTVKYNTTTTAGKVQKSSAGQLSQSAHFALQLPYVIFGLGQTPNFVDSVGVGIPKNSSTESRSHVWQQIIPNSQLIVIPRPPDKPSEWKMKLFVTPSHQIWLTGISLAGTCLLVAIIVVALHLYERREDNKEKKQESQKFHFDAM